MKYIFFYRFQLILLLILAPILLFAQGKQANNWYFGHYCALNFNTGSPPSVLHDSKMWDFACSATMSDENGSLLFYGSMYTIWNRNHQVMQNADKLVVGNSCVAMQSALAVPDPGNANLYYYFNFTCPDPNSHNHTFQYSVIDMRLDGGLGGILPDKKCIPLYYPALGNQTAVKHSNQVDFWIITHKEGSNTFLTYKVTAQGVEGPFISNAGSVIPYNQVELYNYIKLSPDGKKIAVTYNGEGTDYFCEVLDFDNNTGIISDANIVHIDVASSGIEFSPDNKLLYVNSGFLYQYDLTAGTPQQIVESEMQISNEGCYFCGALQVGPDGKIYCITDDDQLSLGVIHNPSIQGLGCNFEPNSIYIGGENSRLEIGLPQFIQSYLNDPEFTYTQHCSGQPTQFNIVDANGIDSVFWRFKDFGNFPNDTSTLFSPLYTFSAPDTYYPELTVWSGFISKTVKDTVVIYASPVPDLGNDTIFCPNDPIHLTLNAAPGEQYNWNNNLTPGDSTFIVSDTGTYWVKVIDHGCIGRDTINVASYDEAIVSVEPSITPSNCGLSDGSITGIQVIAPDPFTITWLDAGGNQVGTGNDLLNVPAGSYFAEVTYGNECTLTFGPYSIADNNAPVIASALPEDDDHCYQGMGSIIITPKTGSVTDYQYSFNGLDYFPLTAEITGLTAGPYNITLKDQFGCISAPSSVEVENVEGPDINCIPTPENGSNGDGSITVISSGVNLTYQLEGSSPQSGNVFNGLSANTYYVIVTDEFGCPTRDTVVVESLQGSLLVALADKDRKCHYKPANSDIRITRVTGMKDLKATLYYNNNILNCTNFNANSATFPGITAQLFTTPPRVELAWQGTSAITSNVNDTLSLGSMIFETLQEGVADVTWEANSTITYFLNESGDSIHTVFFPGDIIIHEIPEIAIDQSHYVCEQDSITLIPQITGGTDPIDYIWQTPNDSSQSQQFEVLNAKLTDAGNYQITVSDYFYCADTVKVNLTVVPLPRANFPATNPSQDTIPFEQAYLLEATPGYASYEWNTGDMIYYINVTEEGEYTVTMQTEEGCKAVESVYMLETFVPIQIPNAFTPNSDGLNDTFRPIVNTELVRQFSMSIYNKWGQLIFETRNASKGWNGEDAMPGVYNWVISYKNRVGKVNQMKGSVAVVK